MGGREGGELWAQRWAELREVQRERALAGEDLDCRSGPVHSQWPHPLTVLPRDDAGGHALPCSPPPWAGKLPPQPRKVKDILRAVLLTFLCHSRAQIEMRGPVSGN